MFMSSGLFHTFCLIIVLHQCFAMTSHCLKIPTWKHQTFCCFGFVLFGWVFFLFVFVWGFFVLFCFVFFFVCLFGFFFEGGVCLLFVCLVDEACKQLDLNPFSV